MRRRMIASILAAAALFLLPACADVSKAKEEATEPAEMVPFEGSDHDAIVVQPEAVKRLRIETAPIEAGARADRTTMPSAAVFYGVDGETWIYTNPDVNTYLRVPIAVEDIEGETAHVRGGPEPGTQVVVVGAPELFGVEEGVDH
jgi:hypothetical protein